MKKLVIATLILALLGTGIVWLLKTKPLQTQKDQILQNGSELNQVLSEKEKPSDAQAQDFSYIPTPSELQKNMQVAGLPTLSKPGTVFRARQHIDIVINGKMVFIPANIGITDTFVSPLHTKDQSGILYVESPKKEDFTLGQFFTQWGILLTDKCIGTYCEDADHSFVVGVNGIKIANPQNHILQNEEEIEIWLGPSNQSPGLIKKYPFPKKF